MNIKLITISICIILVTGCVCKSVVQVKENDLKKKITQLCIKDQMSKEMCDYLLKE